MVWVGQAFLPVSMVFNQVADKNVLLCKTGSSVIPLRRIALNVYELPRKKRTSVWVQSFDVGFFTQFTEEVSMGIIGCASNMYFSALANMR